MGDKSWKAWERRVAKMFGGQRRGADYADRYSQAGKNDIILDGYSLEVKLYKRPHWQMMQDAVTQAENARESDMDIPAAIVKKKYDPDESALVIMHIGPFLEFFGPVPTGEEE